MTCLTADRDRQDVSDRSELARWLRPSVFSCRRGRLSKPGRDQRTPYSWSAAAPPGHRMKHHVPPGLPVQVPTAKGTLPVGHPLHDLVGNGGSARTWPRRTPQCRVVKIIGRFVQAGAGYGCVAGDRRTGTLVTGDRPRSTCRERSRCVISVPSPLARPPHRPFGADVARVAKVSAAGGVAIGDRRRPPQTGAPARPCAAKAGVRTSHTAGGAVARAGAATPVGRRSRPRPGRRIPRAATGRWRRSALRTSPPPRGSTAPSRRSAMSATLPRTCDGATRPMTDTLFL